MSINKKEYQEFYNFVETIFVSVASSVFLSNRNEFSDDEEPVNSSTRDVTGTTQNVIGTSQNVTGTSQNAEFVERLKENATKVWKNVATRSRDLYNSARFKNLIVDIHLYLKTI